MLILTVRLMLMNGFRAKVVLVINQVSSSSLVLSCNILARLCSINHWGMDWMLHAHLSVIKLNMDLTIRKLSCFENCYNQGRHDLYSNKQRHFFFSWSIWGQGMREIASLLCMLSPDKLLRYLWIRVVTLACINHCERPFKKEGAGLCTRRFILT